MGRAETPTPMAGSRLLQRGESVIASTGLAMAAILLLAVAGAGAWTVFAERGAERDRLRSQLDACGQTLARTLEIELAENKVWPVRTVVLKAASDHNLANCRVSLSDGQVVAEGPTKRGDLKDLPEEWPQGASLAPKFELSKGMATLTLPLDVPHRGSAALEVAKPLRYSLVAGWEGQTGLAAIAICGAVAVLVVYRRLRWRLRALGAIREALLAMERGETAASALAVSSVLGAEATAWNQLLEERETLRREIKSDRAKESLGGRKDLKTDLVQACDAMSQGLLLVDEGMKIRYANGAAAAFLKTKREGMAGSSISEHLKDAEVITALKAVVEGGSRKRATVETRRGEGEGVGVLRLSVRPVRKEDGAAALVMIEDITQQRVADEARNAFVAQATHELRTPLTNIRLYTEQAIEGGDDKQIRTRALDVINQESRRLERIVGDMLSVSEMEAGAFQIRTGDVRLENLFDDLKAEYEAQAKEKQLALSLKLPPKLPVLKGDRDKIVLALHNLMGNALKYTPEGGKVEVSVEADETQLKVDVADTGIGVAPEETELIFDKFYRAKDKRVSDITGTGLGLALAREVARMHGGDISVRSQLDKGSTFTLTLPIRAEAA